MAVALRRRPWTTLVARGRCPKAKVNLRHSSQHFLMAQATIIPKSAVCGLRAWVTVLAVGIPPERTGQHIGTTSKCMPNRAKSSYSALRMVNTIKISMYALTTQKQSCHPRNAMKTTTLSAPCSTTTVTTSWYWTFLGMFKRWIWQLVAANRASARRRCAPKPLETKSRAVASKNMVVYLSHL